MSEPIQPEETRRPGAALEVDEQLVADISTLIQTARPAMVLNIVMDMYPVDLAVLLRHLPIDEARQLFDLLPDSLGSEILPELESNVRTQLLEAISHDRMATLLDELNTDDAVDVLSELPDEITRQVLPALEDAGDLRDLLAYPDDTAGGIMGTELVAVKQDWTIAEATEEVRRHAELVEHIYTVFVTDDEGVLEGVVSLKNLLLTPATERIESAMDRGVISVTPEVDQEEVARIMERYDLISLAVVTDDGVLIGRITIDDVVDVIREEAEEDFQLMHGVSANEEPSDSVLQISRGRLPWLLVGLFGASISGLVIGTFEEGLEQAVVLAMFIPIVTAMGGNAAVQSAAIAVQGLSSGHFWPGDAFKRLAKEGAVAMLNGLVLSLLIGLMVYILGIGDLPRLALTVSLTMFVVILLATTNGALVPFILQKMGIDPASAMGPFVTTANDILGLTVFFLIASALYL